MIQRLLKYESCYLHLHADCIPVKGAARSAIYDLTRNEIIFFPTTHFEVLEFLTSGKIGELLQSLECEEELEAIDAFIAFLEAHELIMFLKDVSLFPGIEARWEAPATITNAIIDVDAIRHDFNALLNALDELGCQFVQVRSFADLLSLEDIRHILSASLHKSIQGVELIIKYDPDIPDEEYIRLTEDYPILSNFTLHSAPSDRNLAVTFGCDEEAGKYITKQVNLVHQAIDSAMHCGILSVKNLNAPSVSNFFETKRFNGCLNRKISVDSNGAIKNCPSMTESYGNIRDTDLASAILQPGFRDKWSITKDQVTTCRDCELRYACSDCRAYLENPRDLYSKPLKCGYNPYSCEWEAWSDHPLKQEAIRYYQLEQTATNQGD